MRNEEKISKIYCDVCSIELSNSDFAINDGKFRGLFMTKEDFDICPTCAMEILYQVKMTKEELKEKIDKCTRKTPSIPNISIDDLKLNGLK